MPTQVPTSGAPPRAGVNAVQGSTFIARTLSPPATGSLSRTSKSSPNLAVPLSPSIKEEAGDSGLADELDYISVTAPSSVGHQLVRSDKASRILGVQHRRSMEPIPAAVRTSIVSTRSAREVPSIQSFTPTLPLTSLYVVSGLPKAPHTWTLADPDSVLGLTHSEGAVNRWWRAEVLGSTVSPGAGGGKKKKKVKGDTEILKGAGALSKQEVGKMLSKALKLSFTREVEIIASTLQPASTVHTFSFTLPAPSTPLAPSSSMGLLRSSVLSATTSDRPTSNATSLFPYHDGFSQAPPSTSFLGLPSVFPPGQGSTAHVDQLGAGGGTPDAPGSTVTYHGVCLTVWSHADAERSAAIRRTLEANRSRKESAQSLVAARLKGLRADAQDPTLQARRNSKRSGRGPWAANGALTDGETDMDGETDGGVSESDYEVGSRQSHNPGESTLFLPGDAVFWLPYALTLVSRHPIYDLMRDYLTLSWARFSKDVQSHSLQISKILSHPAPRAGDLIKLDASATAKSDSASAGGPDTSLEVIARFPGGLDFGRGLVDINFTMWPLFKALNIDNILTICELALAPTGRVLFFSRYPSMLGVAVSTIKYLVELRGWNGIALPAVHSRDAKIYIDDPGPWILGLATEARYSIRPPPEVCICDLDINYVTCASLQAGIVSNKQQRERFRQRLLSAFDSHYHPDHSVPSEFKEAFPAGRFRPLCKIQAKRGGSSTVVADTIKPPNWWHSTRIIQAFDAVLQEKMRRPSLFKRISSLGIVKRPPQLSAAEQHVQLSIRKRATAFVDARDDLETKIGRLSRRLNFLMTESDLWRDKFVTFEQYAEKLSLEANDLRSKINKEQRETKRLSGLVTMTTVEKTKLQNQLKDTEVAHREALIELQKMRETMETMEQERAEMVAEVEAQIEKALASMAVDIDDDSDSDDSRPASRSSSRPPSRISRPNSRASRSRRASDAGSRIKQIRSFGTESTLVEPYDLVKEEAQVKLDLTKGPVIEEEDEAPLSPTKKRFSATGVEGQQDGMTAVDEGISERSDRIAQKVLQIQQKLENALAADREKQWNTQSSRESESEGTVGRTPVTHPRSRKASGVATRVPQGPRKRGDTITSSRTAASPGRDSVDTARGEDSPMPTEARTPTRVERFDQQGHGHAATAESNDDSSAEGVARAERPRTPTPVTPALTGTTDDSDTDFQSAYSTSPSPRESLRGNFDGHTAVGGVFHAQEKPAPGSFEGIVRGRVSSIVALAQSSPTFSDDTVVSSQERTIIRR
ncbi:DENN domain-containing protein [Lactarius psammicola]|nr:DENN domain-containing protein [Lactarius psammicola]